MAEAGLWKPPSVAVFHRLVSFSRLQKAVAKGWGCHHLTGRYLYLVIAIAGHGLKDGATVPTTARRVFPCLQAGFARASIMDSK
jgi:hypothetical protein